MRPMTDREIKLLMPIAAHYLDELCKEYTLEKVPGMQMAIDADLSRGTITAKDAKERRKEIERKQNLIVALNHLVHALCVYEFGDYLPNPYGYKYPRDYSEQ